MNIFILDKKLEKSIEYHIDRHIVKMPLEAAQMLSTTVAIDRFLGYVPRKLTSEETKFLRQEVLKASAEGNWPYYKPTHVNHPCNIWARSDKTKFIYLYTYLIGLGAEKLHRYPNNPPHKSVGIMDGCYESVQHLPHWSKAGFALAMPDKYKCDDEVESYRKYYCAEKVYDRSGNRMDNWTNRSKPEWFV